MTLDRSTTMAIRELASEAWEVLTRLKYFRCSLEQEEAWEVWEVWGVWEAREVDSDAEGKDANSDLADNICEYLFSNLNFCC